MRTRRSDIHIHARITTIITSAYVFLLKDGVPKVNL